MMPARDILIPLEKNIFMHNWPWLIALVSLVACRHQDQPYASWSVYGGSPEGIRYSALKQIDTQNVQHLQVAWTYHTGDLDSTNNSQIQCNPIIIGETIYLISPKLKVIALDAATGIKKWIYDPYGGIAMGSASFFIFTLSRGLSYWTDGHEERLFYPVGAFIHALDAKTGMLIPTFGQNGVVDLHDGLDREVDDLYIGSSSPGVIYKDLLIVGTRVDEGPRAAPGHIRAYDVITGQRVWIFHTIPHPGEAGYDTWQDAQAWQHIGGANNWAGMTLDEARGIVFVPTGSASFDFYGGKRLGDNLFANTLLALDAANGQRIWHFQTMHHDVWDKDLPTAPALVTIKRGGRSIDAVAQPTKNGYLFILDRETGEPLYPVYERPVSTMQALPGEVLSPTQPAPDTNFIFTRQTFNESDLNDLIPDSSYQELRTRFRSYLHGETFIPPSLRTQVVFPGFGGGAEWGGPAYDPESAIIYINANEIPRLMTMAPVVSQTPPKESVYQAGERLYRRHCQLCHGANQQGSADIPALAKVSQKYSDTSLIELLLTGRRMMPSFKHLATQEVSAIKAFILDRAEEKTIEYAQSPQENHPYYQLPYTMTGYFRFTTLEGYPAIKPPWGTLNAIDLNQGKLLWQIPLGEYASLSQRGIISGTENYGGPVVTAGGLIFIGATRDEKLRVFNKRTGALLKEFTLPAAAYATPAVYSIKRKQFVVIACGGGKLGTKSGDTYIAFSLPQLAWIAT